MSWDDAARAALDAFEVRGDLGEARFGENVSWRVDAADGPWLLRLHSGTEAFADFRTPAVIRSELRWLAALDERLDVPVQRPRRTEVLDVDTPAGRVPASLLRWVPGASGVVEEPRDPRKTAAAGELLAKLHLATTAWKLPADFERPSHDAARFLEESAGWAGLVERGAITGADADAILAAREEGARAIEEEGREPHLSGLIHADLHEDNIVFPGGGAAPSPIDFSLSGFGPHLLDIGTTLVHFDAQGRREAIEGYARVRPLPAGAPARIERLLFVAWLTASGVRARTPANEAGVLRELETVKKRYLPAFLARETFAYD